jgi:hypothetical protein
VGVRIDQGVQRLRGGRRRALGGHVDTIS